MLTKNKNTSYQSGIAHLLLPLIVVLTLSIIGTYFIVRSNAATSTPAGSRTRIVRVARQQLGYAESPTHANKVKFFHWQGDTPAGEGPWCAVFATWVWHAAGVKLDGKPYPKQIAVAYIRDTGRAGGRFHTRPHTGDAIIYGATGSNHVGIVERVSRTQITVIEGNAAYRPGGESKYVIRRVINRQHPGYIPGGKIYGYVSPPSR